MRLEVGGEEGGGLSNSVEVEGRAVAPGPFHTDTFMDGVHGFEKSMSAKDDKALSRSICPRS